MSPANDKSSATTAPTEDFDLFISYSRQDNKQGHVTELVKRIKQDFANFEGNKGRTLVTFFDQEEIHGMEDWRQRILHGLRESRILLACISPSYLKSEYCEWELVEYLKYEIGHTHGFNGIAPIYFVEVPGWGSKEFEQQCAGWVAELRKRQYFDLRPWHSEGEGALRDGVVRERMEQLTNQIVTTIKRGERAEKSLGNVDAHNPHFIGRTANLRKLRENFVTPGRIGVLSAMNGLGGLGKTALAIEYTHAFADKYGGGRWQIRCAGKEDLRLALAELATPIGFEYTDDEKKNLDLQFDRTRRELKKLADTHEPHRCLLLLDNVDRPALLEPAQVARLNGGDWLHVIATTRLGENELHGSHRDRCFLAVDELSPDEALSLIMDYQPNRRFHNDEEREAAREIVRLLGCFTLSVESAAVFLGQFANDVTCAAFLARLKKEGLEGLDDAAGQSSEGVLHGEKRLSATLQPTLERLTEPQKLALEFAALLPPDQVPLPWLRALVGKTFPEMERDADPGHPDPWKNVVRALLSLRLLQATDDVENDGQPRIVRVHRLVQELARNRMTVEEATGHQDAIDMLVRERDEALEKTTSWTWAKWELEPLTELANLWGNKGHLGAAWLLSQCGERWLRLANWSKAEPLLRRALVTDLRILGQRNLNVAIGINKLARLLQETNRLLNAEALFRLSLAILEGIFGRDDPITAATLGSLAGLLQATNRMIEAERFFRRALAATEKGLQPDHPHVASALNNLAQFLRNTNRTEEAILMLQRALAIEEFNAGADRPESAVGLHNLARVYQTTDRMVEAEFLRRRALELSEKSLEAEHPNIAIHLNSLAKLLQDTNRPVEAEGLLRRAVAIEKNNFGPRHPSVAVSLNNLGTMIGLSGRLDEAEPLLRCSMEILIEFAKSAGHEHPNLRTARENYIALLKRMGGIKAEILAHLNDIEKSFGTMPS